MLRDGQYAEQEHPDLLAQQMSAAQQRVHETLPAEATGEQRLRAETALLASDVHTLLASVQRSTASAAQMFDQFPRLARPFRYDRPIKLPEATAPEQSAYVQDLFVRAVEAVGGPDRAQLYLTFPGLTNNEILREVRRVPDSWFEADREANKRGPQMDAAIATKTGRCIAESIAHGTATGEDAVFAYLAREQIEDHKQLAATLHEAFREEPAMPAGYSHANLSYIIPDARFQRLWRYELLGNVIRMDLAATWAELAEGAELPMAETPVSAEVPIPVDPAMAERIDTFFTDERLAPYAHTLLSLYEAADEALSSPEGDALMRKRRQQLNSKRFEEPEHEALVVDEINQLVGEAIEKRIGSLEEFGDDLPLLRNFGAVFTKLLCGQDIPPMRRTAWLMDGIPD